MIITTTDSIEGRNIVQYLGPVSFATTAGGAIGGTKTITRGARADIEKAWAALQEEASTLGADAVVGVKYGCFRDNHFFLGTAVKLG